jgi:phage repressor protein C with HTH and peptisase S24 domain
MLTHEQIWRGVDRLALRNGLSPSGLAKRAGLDPTTFNKSKRVTQDGKQRWPGTESLSKILEATQTSMTQFVTLIDETPGPAPRAAELRLKSIRLSQITEGSFDASGFPSAGEWEDVEFPAIEDPRAYVIELDRDGAQPFSRPGSLVVVSPSSSVRRHDRIILKSKAGALLLGTVKRKTAQHFTLIDTGGQPDETTITTKDIGWIARILWVSQ